MRGFLSLILGLLFCSTSLTAENPFSEIRERGVLRVVTYENQAPPFLIHKEGNKSVSRGIDFEIAKKMASSLGVRLEIRSNAATYNEVVDIVEAGKADLGISKLSITSKRAEKVLFSNPYVKLPLGVVFNRLSFVNSGNRLDVESFNHKSLKVGVFQGSSFAQYIDTRFPKAKKIFFQDREEIYKAIASKKVDFTMVDNQIIKTWQTLMPSLNIKTATYMVPDAFDMIGVAVASENYRLKAWIDIFFMEMESTGSLDKLKEEFLANDYWRQEK
ncbi:MAG: ABC transporter substrate-binding protein [Bdellovibrionota bacterium]|nr:ABC transporter substrate-binding protein [Bdellovibrionota bacterium]